MQVTKINFQTGRCELWASSLPSLPVAALPWCPSEGVPPFLWLLAGQTVSHSYRELLALIRCSTKKTGIQVMHCSIQLQAELVCIISCYFWTKTNCLCVFWVTDANRVLLWVCINTAAQPSAVLLSLWVPIYSLDEAVVSEGSFTTRGDGMPPQLVD